MPPKHIIKLDGAQDVDSSVYIDYFHVCKQGF